MAAMALVQLPILLKTGFRFRLALDIRHPGVHKVYILALPAAVGVAVNQANVYINGVLASWLPEGSISALSYADRLIQFPVSLFVLALGTAVFPTLSGWAARGDREDLAKILLASMKVVMAGIIPASVGLMVLSRPIVRLVFERGALDQVASAMTAAALFFYAVGLVGQASAILLTRGFYALQDTRTPVKLGLVMVAVNLILSLFFIRYLQHAGLALANSLANLTYLVLLLEFLKGKIPGLREGGLFKFTLIIPAFRRDHGHCQLRGKRGAGCAGPGLRRPAAPGGPGHNSQDSCLCRCSPGPVRRGCPAYFQDCQGGGPGPEETLK